MVETKMFLFVPQSFLKCGTTKMECSLQRQQPAKCAVELKRTADVCKGETHGGKCTVPHERALQLLNIQVPVVAF